MKQTFKEKGETWPQILQYNNEKYGGRHVAMRYKVNGIWRPYTWRDYYLNVKQLALGLLSLGLEPGNKVMIIGDNAPQWYFSELATQSNQGVPVGMYSELTPAEIKFIANHSEANFAIVEDQEQVDKLLQIREELPALKKVIYWNYKGLIHYDHPILIGFKEVLKIGEEYERKHPRAFEQIVEKGRADDVCAIVYTSGTTGPFPKGAVHTYRTIKVSAEFLLERDPWNEKDNVVPSLPPVWITEQWIAIGCHLLSGAILNFYEKPETQQQDTREIGPNIVFYGARLWENQASEVQAKILEADPIKRLTSRLLMPMGYKMAELKQMRKKSSLKLKMLYALAHLILFRSIKDKLGLSKARICYNIGAMLSPEVFKFYHALNLPLKSLYGTTEGGVLTCARNEDIQMDTIGPVLNSAEIQITEMGELIYRHSGVFMGYYKEPDKTAEVLKDGWFYTGDSVFIREDGHLVFKDRLKDIVDLDGGGQLAPQLIESRLRSSPYIKDAWVLAGPERAYPTAIITIHYDSVSRWAGQRGLIYRTFAELSQKLEVYQLIENYIDRVNQDLPLDVRIKKFVIMPKEFTPEESELTRNRKLRRSFLEDYYRDLILTIYSDQTEMSFEVGVSLKKGITKSLNITIKIKTIRGD